MQIDYQRYPNESSSGLNVPPYAFMPLESNNEFNLAGAPAAAAGQATSASPSSSTSSASSSHPPSTMTSFPSTISTTSTSASSAASTSGYNLEIVIAVIVVLTLLSTTAGIYFFYTCRKRHSYAYKPVQGDLVTAMLTDADKKHGENQVEQLPVSTKTRIFANFSLPRGLRWSNTARASPFGKIQLPQKGVENVAPSKQPPQTQKPRSTHMPTSSITNGSYQPQSIHRWDQPKHGQGLQRPRPTRIDTLPVMQIITRPVPRRSQSSTLPEASTSPRDTVPLHPSPEGVKNVPRRPGFTIEDTPTTAEGYPTWRRKKPAPRRDFFNPEIGASVTSFGSYSTVTQRIDGDDSDSVLLISRSGDNFDVASPNTVRSFSDTSVDLSSRSMAGSSVPPVSPAISTRIYREQNQGSGRGPDAREQLFPASVRAAGYTGLPPRKI
ncbi:hypothetical protein JB92DRAFT_3125653 [Gautieria morchelliformis]|nr:hypothetical protein JB92DRAFT_3125653 [Gautieria morchelliformis]